MISSRPCRGGGVRGRTRLVLVATIAASPLAAQFERPDQRIREIADEIAKEMQRIDRLLLQKGEPDAKAAAEGMARNVARIDELLQQTGNAQDNVQQKIDALIKALLEMQQQGQSNSPQEGQQQSPHQQGQPQGRQQRAPNERPDGEQPPTDPQPQPAQPQQGAKQPGQAPPPDASDTVDHASDQERWGVLPFYEDFVKGRGGNLAVPERYRRYHEAFLRQTRKAPRTPPPEPDRARPR